MGAPSSPTLEAITISASTRSGSNHRNAMFCLILVWGFAWEVARAVFKLDEVQWWNREIEYAEIGRWLTGR